MPIVIDGSNGIFGITQLGVDKVTDSTGNNPVDFPKGATINDSKLYSHTYIDQNKLFASNAQTTLNVPDVIVVVNGNLHNILEQNIDINSAIVWDDSQYATGSNRAGKDFYVYALDGSPYIKLSANSTFPSGYNENTSRKIGGFHCLCVSVGTIAGHTLSGYIAGDILPRSVWDRFNRSAGRQEGTVLSRCGKWIDIYLPSVAGDTLVSVNGGTIADGTSSPAFHTYKFEQWFARQGMSTISQQEFFAAADGANQSTNIAGSADPVTTTGHVDTAGRRMISNEGVEDACGVLWQWGRDIGGVVTNASYINAYDANDDPITKGQHFQAPYRCLLGGNWADGVICGVRTSNWINSPLILNAFCSARGACEPAKTQF